MQQHTIQYVYVYRSLCDSFTCKVWTANVFYFILFETKLLVCVFQ